jgi:2-oxoacid:acceptor oxidoreductase delta subunit (pyruvate/2-ketoisovalerate family)
MGELRRSEQLAPGGVVVAADTVPLQTGSWRTGVKPVVDLSRCVNCLLCWVYCPDSAIVIDGTTFTGFDLDVCKGCEICAEVCPVQAVEMVAEDEDGD